jgi:hypothetical protein
MPAGVSAYTALANVTLGSAVLSVTFSSINQGFRDLVVVISGRETATSGNNNSYLRFNTDSGSNYSMVRMSGSGSGSGDSDTVSGVTVAGWAFIENSSTSNFTPIIYNIMDYSATDKHKTVLGRGAGASNFVSATASRWANTAAITSVEVRTSTTSFVAGSTISLYGVSA